MDESIEKRGCVCKPVVLGLIGVLHTSHDCSARLSAGLSNDSDNPPFGTDTISVTETRCSRL